MNAIEATFVELLNQRGITLSDQQLKQFHIYYESLIEWNEKINLTAITAEDEVYEKHFYDSLSLSFYADLSKVERLADIGSGAGFPSIPLKILFPHLKVVIIDSLNKRILFLQELCQRLGLTDVTCLHSRAEDAARNAAYRDQFDLVTARAVARLNILNELCLPFVKPRGTFAAMKGSSWSDEINDAKRSLKELKANVSKQHTLVLPHESSERAIILISKSGPTPVKYPRKAGLPVKQPL